MPDLIEDDNLDNDVVKPQEGEPKVFDEDYVKKLRAENAKWRTEAQANSEAAGKLAEIEAAKLSDIERAQAAAEADRTARAATDAENLRLRVALNNAVPAAMVDRLRGTTEEELVADWETNVKPLLGTSGPAPTVDPYLGHPSHTKTSSRDLGSAEADRRFGASN